MAGLLDGMRVLDFAAWRPMPHATQILADLGAEVLKVEPPGGDPMRAYPEIFASVARGKRSIVLDLRTDAGRARAHELAAEAGVVCEGWRPGVATRLGVGYDDLAAAHPELVYCSLSGYGQDGPARDAPGHDVNFQALAGALARRPGDPRPPEVPQLPVADLEGGTVSALVICAAWARRLATGVGEHIDISMTDVVAWWVGPRTGTAHVDAAGRQAGSPGYGLFRAADGGWIALGALGEARLWAAICRGLDLRDLEDLTFAQRLERAERVTARIEAAVGALDRDVALARLAAAGAPASPVLAPEAARDHPQLRARAFHVETAAGPVAAFPPRLRHAPTAPAGAVPAIDAHPDGFTRRPG